MKKYSTCSNCCLLLVMLFILACGSSSVKKDDMSILTSRRWNSSKTGNSWTVIRFYRDLRGDIKNLTSLGLDQYQEYKFTWRFVGKDSIMLKFRDQGAVTFRVYSLNDSNLVINNWIVSPSDTSRTTFYADRTGMLPE